MANDRKVSRWLSHVNSLRPPFCSAQSRPDGDGVPEIRPVTCADTSRRPCRLGTRLGGLSPSTIPNNPDFPAPPVGRCSSDPTSGALGLDPSGYRRRKLLPSAPPPVAPPPVVSCTRRGCTIRT